MYFKTVVFTALFMTGGALANPTFTSEEAKRGEALYNSKCSSCHGRELIAKGDPPSLTGEQFGNGWFNKSLADRFGAIKESMPPNDAGNLPDRDVLDIIAYILKFNGYAAGATPLPTQPSAMEAVTIQKR
jgi:mono/diheme cytochrome c family protein